MYWGRVEEGTGQLLCRNVGLELVARDMLAIHVANLKRVPNQVLARCRHLQVLGVDIDVVIAEGRRWG